MKMTCKHLRKQKPKKKKQFRCEVKAAVAELIMKLRHKSVAGNERMNGRSGALNERSAQQQVSSR